MKGSVVKGFGYPYARRPQRTRAHLAGRPAIYFIPGEFCPICCYWTTGERGRTNRRTQQEGASLRTTMGLGSRAGYLVLSHLMVLLSTHLFPTTTTAPTVASTAAVPPPPPPVAYTLSPPATSQAPHWNASLTLRPSGLQQLPPPPPPLPQSCPTASASPAYHLAALLLGSTLTAAAALASAAAAATAATAQRLPAEHGQTGADTELTRHDIYLSNPREAEGLATLLRLAHPTHHIAVHPAPGPLPLPLPLPRPLPPPQAQAQAQA